ncbi:P-loop containing nucleoside triphosphate hydrolase protein [Trichoderma sp. SZMC 28013]
MSHSRSVDNNTFGDYATIHQGDVNNVFNYSQERRETPPQPFPLIPFGRDPDFVNRGDILQQISARCLEPAGRVALVGLGGVGKSQLAIEFAHRFSEEHKNMWVFWIHAATQARVQEGFRLIADAVKLAGREQPKADIPLLVRNWLSIEHNGRWVIILDSADDADVLYGTDESGHDKRSLAAYIPNSRNGSIVLTTRNRGLASRLTGGHHHIIDVDTMPETDAFTLFEKKMGSPLSPLDAGLAEDLVKALECMPLAICQAAAYIQARRPRSSIKKYLAEFRESDQESMKLLKYEANDVGRDEETSNTVLRTWAISFDYIRSHQRSAADLLSLMSFFDRQGIPEWVLTNSTRHSSTLDANDSSESVAGDDSDAESRTADDSDSETNSSFEEDISILRNHCLITVNEEGDKFEMHRLVQLSIKSWLKAAGLQKAFMQQYIKRMALSFPRADYENWAICQDLFAHVQVALDYRPNEETLEVWASLCYRGGKYAHQQGKDHLAEQMVKKCTKASERMFGYDNERTLSRISLLASIISQQGRWDEAEKLQVQVLKTCKSKLGAEHQETLKNMGSLALTYEKQGRWDEAIKLQAQVLKIRKKTLGADHLNTLRSMGNLALAYQKQDRWDEAGKLQEQVLEAHKIKLGADHPNTLRSMGNLAVTYQKQDRWDEAGKLQVQALEASKKTLGADHPNTLRSMSNLTLTYRRQGRWDEAEELRVQVLEAYKIKIGANHPTTLKSMRNLALIWKRQGRHEEALALMKDCLQRRQRFLGLQHPDTLLTMKTVEEWSNEDDAGDWGNDDGEEG